MGEVARAAYSTDIDCHKKRLLHIINKLLTTIRKPQTIWIALTIYMVRAKSSSSPYNNGKSVEITIQEWHKT